MGPSGAGKSTLLNILGLMLRADSIQYVLKNAPIPDEECWPKLRSQVFGFVFQQPHCLDYRSVQDNLLLPTLYCPVSKEASLERAKRLLTELGLGNRLHDYPSQLSGGEQQRVSVARALMNGPEILLADELTSHLDSQHANYLMDFLKAYAVEEGLSLIFVTHDEKMAARCDRQYFLKEGVLCPL